MHSLNQPNEKVVTCLELLHFNSIEMSHYGLFLLPQSNALLLDDYNGLGMLKQVLENHVLFVNAIQLFFSFPVIRILLSLP
ncbi:Uncharacterised protein [Klebsiella pneumoniae]|nr:Uncharacterised protein [Klebsiella pneumoniae]